MAEDLTAPSSPAISARHDATFVSPTTGDRIYYYHCSPASPRGLVAFFHGLMCHSNMPMFHALARECMAHGLAFAAWDCPHHGRSTWLAEGNVLKPQCMRGNGDDLVANASAFLDEAVRLYPTLPLVIFGQSFGGALCTRLAAMRSDLRGAFLLSPACPDVWTRRPRWLACMVYKWRMARFVVRSLRGIDRERRQAFHADPFGAKRLPSLSTLGVVYDLVKPASAPDAVVAVLCPVSILHGSRDDLIPWDIVVKLHDCLCGQRKEIRFVPRGTHDMLADAHTVRVCSETCVSLVGDAV